MTAKTDLPIESFASAKEWESWLERHHTSARGLWLKLAKNDSGRASPTYDEAVDVALCFGWIDGQKDRFDETYWLQRFTPRSPRSNWSQANRKRAETLIREGRMRRAGLEQVERAKSDGRWQAAYAGQRTATVPADLQRALEQDEEALRFFSALDSRNRYAILYRVQAAKRPETRTKRIKQFVQMLARHEKIYA